MTTSRTKYEAKLFQMTQDEHIFKFLTQENPDLATRDAFLKSYLKLDNSEAILLSALAYAKKREKYHWQILNSKTELNPNDAFDDRRKHKFELARSAVSELKAFISLSYIQSKHNGLVTNMNAQRIEITRMPRVQTSKY